MTARRAAHRSGTRTLVAAAALLGALAPAYASASPDRESTKEQVATTQATAEGGEKETDVAIDAATQDSAAHDTATNDTATHDTTVTGAPRDRRGRFRNNFPHDEHGLRDLIRWANEHRKVDVTPVRFPVADDAAPRATAVPDDESALTWIGHSTFLLQLDGFRILTDPHFTERASPVAFAGPERTTEPGVELADLPPVDVVVISHNHYDHLDKGSIRALFEKQRDDPPLVLVPLGLGRTLERWGAEQVIERDWWESSTVDGWTFTAVPVQHFSARTPFDRNKTLWAGWVFESASRPGLRTFFAGDTGYSRDFADIRERMGAIDLALLPIGAYDPRWFMEAMHVDPEQAVQIHLDLEATRSVGMHWGTFILTDEPMREPLERLAAAREAAGLAPDAFLVLQHGETIPLDSTEPE